ncbi:hypothetical protein K4W85_14695 [Pseudomonas aeruginosa]|uniref:hypothetical protein n=1 Tax=Pseudomonas aeruginosa TaxID=287 RepID=UPI001E323D0F|nr:hypothetical protein [Pseudomonas aeruginosa]MCD2747750.1 hypothetical protein [Pseudomonas aeruginosa]
MITNNSKAPSCTCPSGDGSLRHPCPAHPAVEQAGGDERAAFEAWLAQAMSKKFDPEFDLAKYEDSGEYRYSPAAAYWKAWQARAALAQPSPVLPPFAEKVLAKLRRFYDCASDFESGGVDIGRHWLDLLTQLGLLNRVQRSPALWEITQQGEDLLGTPQPSPAQADEKPGDSILCYGCFAKGVGPEHFDEAGKCLVRQQLDPLNLAQHAEEFNEAPAEALKPEQAEAERPEVVAYFDRNYPSTGDAFIWSNYEGSPYEPVMTVAQHERIVKAWIERWKAYIELSAKIAAQRDAALARVAELGANLGAALGLLRESRGFVDRDNPLNESGQIKLLEEIDAFLNSPVAQAQHSVPRAWLDVQAERRRQITVEGYHGFRDSHYINYELSKAARAYIEVSWHALSGGLPCKKPESWPWMAGFKWSDGRTMLVKACALTLAEIERLDRAAAPGKEVGHE